MSNVPAWISDGLGKRQDEYVQRWRKSELLQAMSERLGEPAPQTWAEMNEEN